MRLSMRLPSLGWLISRCRPPPSASGVRYTRATDLDWSRRLVTVAGNGSAARTKSRREQRGEGSRLVQTGLLGPRQPQFDRGAFPELAADLHRPSPLRGKSLDHRQAEAGTRSEPFGRKEWLECSCERFLIHAGPGVADRHDHVFAPWGVRRGAGVGPGA